jgi:hypothetical protein
MNWALLIELLPQLLQAALQAVNTIEQATGKPTEAAVQEVVNHVTPGAPLSPTLSVPPAT